MKVLRKSEDYLQTRVVFMFPVFAYTKSKNWKLVKKIKEETCQNKVNLINALSTLQQSHFLL